MLALKMPSLSRLPFVSGLPHSERGISMAGSWRAPPGGSPLRPRLLCAALLCLSACLAPDVAAAAAAATTASASKTLEPQGPLVASKCCPRGQQFVLITAASFECVQRGQGNHEHDAQQVGEREAWSEALARAPPGGIPEWMDARAAEPMVPANLTAHAPTQAHVRYGVQPPCEEGERQMIPVSNLHRMVRVLPSGALELNLTALGGAGTAVLKPEDFCWEHVRSAPRFPNGTHVLVACPCARVTCFRKCCRQKQLFGADGVSECVNAPGGGAGGGRGIQRWAWQPTFEDPAAGAIDPALAGATFHLLSGSLPSCGPEERRVLLNGLSPPSPPRHMRSYANGSARMQHFGGDEPYAAGRWCGEMRQLQPGGESLLQVVQDAVFCVAPEPPPPTSPHVVALGCFFLVGALFLALTVSVYALLPELRAPPHAKALMCHSAALLVASLALATMQLIPVVSDAICHPTAIIIQFSFLAAFFWLNVLCFDISWAFSGLRGLLGGLLDTSRRKFFYYSLYAWGCPLVISAITVGIHYADRNRALPDWVIVPSIAVHSCWFYGEAAHWVYIYGPMAALLAANAALFVFTAARLAAAQCDAAQLNRGDSVRHDRSSRLSAEKRRFILYTKLFLLMGVTWVLEVISWSTRQDEQGEKLEVGWFIFDVINSLRGLFIFIIFCCKRKVVLMLRRRVGLSAPASDGSSSRSPASRSQTSTRQSSLLQLAPMDELAALKNGRRPSAASVPVSAEMRQASSASAPMNRKATVKAPRRPSAPVPASSTNGGGAEKAGRRPSALAGLATSAYWKAMRVLRRPSAASSTTTTPAPTPTPANEDDTQRRPSNLSDSTEASENSRRPSVTFESNRVTEDASHRENNNNNHNNIV